VGLRLPVSLKTTCNALAPHPPFSCDSLYFIDTIICMTTIGMHYDVIPGKELEFEKGFLGVLELLKTLPGHVESHMYEDVAVVGSYVILSEWKTKDDFEAFLKSPDFAKAVAWGKAEILRSRPRHKVYTNQ
jgi:heme-degrading monooxygenase HmoA